MPSQPTPEQNQARALPLAALEEAVLQHLEAQDESGITEAVDIIISQSAYYGASDLHLEPWAEYLSMRYRIDGILQQVALIPNDYQAKIIARIKVLADLVVYRKDVPQDGRIDFSKTSCNRPMRVSTVPTINGEKVVIRLLGDADNVFQLDLLGFQDHIVEDLRELILLTQGTLLLTGPSSSGKTTTIYALLQEMMDMQMNTTNIVTIEDPVENTMDCISQLQVNPNVEFTFASALRAILRQDPEVIMVGEIRDVETANMAIQAGLTGHFVISTIHSGTAPGVFTRLLDMGIEPFLVASSITGVLAQRLIRLNCPDCLEAYQPDSFTLEHFGLEKSKGKFYQGMGCETCNEIGYRGRASIGELLLVNDEFSEEVLHRCTSTKLYESAKAMGMETMAEDGIKKARKKITTLEELVRVLPSGVL